METTANLIRTSVMSSAGDLMGTLISSSSNLKQDDLEKERQWTLESCRIQNQIPGKLNLRDGINCSKCLNKGYVLAPDETGLEEIAHECECMRRRRIVWAAHDAGLGPMLGKKFSDFRTDEQFQKAMYDSAKSHECECMRRRRIVWAAHDAGLGPMLGKKFSDFRTDEQFQKAMYDSAKSYCANPEGWFCVSGQPGSGKTLICMIVANQLLRDGHELKYTSWPELVREAAVDWYKQKEILQEYQRVEVLYIDDFLKEAESGRALSIAYEILNYRYNHRSLTIISGEKGMDELMNVDQAMASRIYELSKSHYIDLGHGREKNQRLK